MANKNIFNDVKGPSVKRSVFDLSHNLSLSCKMGKLIPVLAQDVVPGDKFHLSQEALVRFLPMVAPPFTRFNVTFHSWYVANRTLWSHFDEYITETKVGGNYVVPPSILVSRTDVTPGSLYDYMGVPVAGQVPGQNTDQTLDGLAVNALPFAAYQRIWNDNYRDQNLQADIAQDLILLDGDNDNIELRTLRDRAWEHDYFTSALPSTQKGDPVSIPIALGDSPVKINHPANAGTTYQDPVPGWHNGAASPTDLQLNAPTGDPDIPGVSIQPNALYADNSQAAVFTTLNDFRRANAIQRFRERLMRVGSRFTEFIKGVFGVDTGDARVDRPEYIGGSKSPVVISEVLNTTGTDDAPQGAMAGHGSAYVNGVDQSYYVREHGWIITVMNIQPVPEYQQGIPKRLLRITDPADYFTPDYANLGEEAIQNMEVYAWTINGTQPFGYTPRYSDYKYNNNRAAGQMLTSLNFWTASRIFDNAPALNAAFIACNPTKRFFAVTDPDDDPLVIIVRHKIKAVRPMPYFGTPSL